MMRKRPDKVVASPLRAQALHVHLLACLAAAAIIGYTAILPRAWHGGSQLLALALVLECMALSAIVSISALAYLRWQHHDIRYRRAVLVAIAASGLSVVVTAARAAQLAKLGTVEARLDVVAAIAVYAMTSLGWLVLVPVTDFPRHCRLRLLLNAMLCMSAADLAMQVVLPALLPQLHIMQPARAIQMRLAMTLGFCFLIVQYFWRYATLAATARRFLAVDLALYAITDVVFLITMVAIAEGQPGWLVVAAMPVAFAQQLVRALGLYAVGAGSIDWRTADRADINVPMQASVLSITWPGAVLVILATVAVLPSAPTYVRLTFALLLAAQTIISSFEQGKRLERQQAAHDQLGKATDEIRNLLNAGVDHSAYVAHDLGHELTALQQECEALWFNLAHAGVHSSTLEDLHDALQESLDQQRDLLLDMSDATRLEQGRLVPRAAAVDWMSLWRGTISHYQTHAARAVCQLRVDTCSEPIYVHGDRALLERVVRNLIRDVLAVCATGGETTIRLTPTKTTVCTVITVASDQLRDCWSGIRRMFNERALQAQNGRVTHEYVGATIRITVRLPRTQTMMPLATNIVSMETVNSA